MSLFFCSTQQNIQRPSFFLWGLWRHSQRRLRFSFFSSKSHNNNNNKTETFSSRHWVSSAVTTLPGFSDCLMSEQHPPAVPHEPRGHTRAHPRLRPLPGPRGLVQQSQAPCLFWSESGCLPIMFALTVEIIYTQICVCICIYLFICVIHIYTYIYRQSVCI